MPNMVIKLLDSPAPISQEALLRSLAEVPFVRHQYRWLVSELALLPPAASTTMLAGYCGIRRMTPAREIRLAEACSLVSAMLPSEIAALPASLGPGQTLPPRTNPPLSPPPRPTSILRSFPPDSPKCH